MISRVWEDAHNLRLIRRSRASFRLCCSQKFPHLLDVPLETSAREDEKLISRLMRGWDPNYIAEACPLVATTVLGPSAVNAKFACELAADPENPRPMYLEMVKLVLGKIGTYWEIGALILDKSSLFPFPLTWFGSSFLHSLSRCSKRVGQLLNLSIPERMISIVFHS